MPKEIVKYGKPYALVQHQLPGKDTSYYTQEPADTVGKNTTHVSTKQAWLKARRNEDDLKIDGILGPKTLAAIKRYQEFLGIKADGIWGPDTQQAHEKYFETFVRLTREPNVEIVWTRPEETVQQTGVDPAGWVQIGIDLDGVDLEDRMRYSGSNTTAKTFYTESLTRHQINELIRVLKRARNAAYGSDE